MSKECTEPRNPATITCRNCDESKWPLAAYCTAVANL